MAVDCGKHAGEEKFMWGFGGKIWRDHLKLISVWVGIILKLNLLKH